MNDDTKKKKYKRMIKIILLFVFLACTGWYVVWWFTPSPNELSIKDSLAIMKIIEKGNLKSLNYKLDHGLNPNSLLCNRTTWSLIRNGSFSSDIVDDPLINYACSDGTSEIVKTLIDHGAKVNDPDGNNAPLAYAISSLNITMVKMLLEHGAYVNQKDSNEETPLMVLANYTDPGQSPNNIKITNICKLLLKYKAIVNDVNFQGETALSKFIDISDHDSNYEIIKSLIQNHANPNIKDMEGRTLIQAAMLGHNLKIAAYLRKVTK